MTTLRNRVLEYLGWYPSGADDDRLAAELRVPQRQSVNKVCRDLALAGLVLRQPDPALRKIVNRLAPPRGTAPPRAMPADPDSNGPSALEVGGVVHLAGRG